MKNNKSLSLVLALPLILTACGDHDTVQTVTPPVVPEPAPEIEIIEVESDTEVDAEAEVLEPVADEAVVANEGAQTTTEEPDEIVPVEAVEVEVEIETEPEPAAVVPAPVVETGLTGTFTYNTSYPTPKGVTAMDTTFVVENGVIQSFSLAGNPAHRTSVDHQVSFEAEQGIVAGKSLEEAGAAPRVVGGSSLTSIGFNKALELLKAEA